MKYTIYGFSQLHATEMGLDDRDLMVLRWFVDYKDTGKMVKKIINDDMFYWIKYEGIIDSFPIVKWKKDTVYRRLKKMASLGVLKHETVKQGGVWSYYALGSKYIVLLDTNGEINPVNKEVGNKSEWSEINPNQTEINPEQNINLLYSNKKEEEKADNSPCPKISDTVKKERTSLDKLIAEYTSNTELIETLKDFLKMRKTIKKPMTDKALKLLLNKLNKYAANDDNKKIYMLNESIEHSWQTVYEPKDYIKDIPKEKEATPKVVIDDNFIKNLESDF